MPDTEESPTPESPQDRRLILFWSVGLVLFYILVGALIIPWVRQNKLAEDQRLQALIESPTTQLGATYTEAPPPGYEGAPAEVQAGVYLNQIPDISLRDFYWTVDFLVWFTWEGEGLDPGETFAITGGQILSREKVAESVQGTTHYARYHVTAQVYKFFDVSRFPLNQYVLTLAVEDSQHPAYALRYVADAQNSAVGPRVRILEGVRIIQSAALVKLQTYPTGLGDPTLPPGYQPAYSTFIYGVWTSSPGLRFYLKLFLALFVSVLLAISVFFIKPTDVDPRFGLGVGALFASVANAYIISSSLPPSGGVVLVDMVNSLGVATIFLTVVESILSLYLYDIRDKQALSRRLDRVSAAIFLVAYIALNVAIPLAALA